jgi:parvulin-like peptidyl-prolyl isomerase
MLDRFRNRGGRGSGNTAIARQRRVSRRDREHRQRQLLYIGTAIAGAVVVIALAAGAIWQYYIYPRQDLASVNGEAIERRDYWMVRELQLRQTIAQLSQQFQFADATQQEEIRQRVELAQSELEDVPGAPIASDTLQSMVDNQVVVQNMGEVGVSVSDEDVDTYIAEQFAPVPLTEPTPTATIEPTAAAWATETRGAQEQQATATGQATQTIAAQTATAAGTPAASPTGEADVTGTAATTATTAATTTAEATTTAKATATGTAAQTAATGTATEGSPTAEGSPTSEGSPAATETATPNAEQALATSETTFDLFSENFLNPSDMSRSDYERLVARPEVARQKVRETLINQIPSRQEQVHAAHILVATKEAADAVVARLGTEDFAAVAREVSTDTSTAGNGGDLGWFPRGIMVPTFEETAFSTPPGEVSAPVQSEFGWHVIKVIEKEPDRPLTISTLQTLQGKVFEDWLSEQRAGSDIESDIALPSVTGTAEPSTFEAPPDAPPPPTLTPLPSPTLAPAAPTTGSETPAATQPAEATATP